MKEYLKFILSILSLIVLGLNYILRIKFIIIIVWFEEVIVDWDFISLVLFLVLIV